MRKLMIGKNAEEVIRLAYHEAAQRRHEYISTEHLLMALLEDNKVIQILDNFGVKANVVAKVLGEHLNSVEKMPIHLQYSPEQTVGFQRVFKRAILQVHGSQGQEVDTPNLLIALFEEPESYAVYTLLQFQLTKYDLLNLVAHGISKNDDPDEFMFGEEEEFLSFEESDEDDEDDEDFPWEEEGPNKRSILEKFTENLTFKAEQGQIDPLVGRQNEIERVIQIISRRRKNNVLLLGEPGVGKTAIVYGLARQINEKNVPSFLEDAQIYSLDMGSLLAGTKFRGQFEERLKGVVKALIAQENSLLYISEIHTLVGGGQTSGSGMDAATLLKPALSEGKLKILGSTTYKEYRNYLEKDRALLRRFQNIDVLEPSVEEATKILKGLKKEYEEFHGVKYQEKALESAAKLSAKFINERFLPDKAIDVIDEAGALNKLAGKKEVAQNDVEKLVAKIARIPDLKVGKKEEVDLLNLESKLQKVIFGQNQAIEKVCEIIKVSRAGLRQQDKPVGCFLFSGPTGVGKTELSKQLAEYLSVKFIRFDMSEYMERHSVSRFIGAPPGYVGFDQGGLLTESIRKNPRAILLLDEIEKAHQDVYNVLLQVMDHAKLTDNNGRSSDFRNVIIIMTTNAGSRDSGGKKIGFGERFSHTGNEKAIKSVFSPEFLNRLDARVTFNPLTEKEIIRIVKKEQKALNELLKEKKRKIKLQPSAEKELAKVGYDPEFGARPVSRAFMNKIKKSLTDLILKGKFVEEQICVVSYKKGQFVFEFKRDN